MPSKIRNSDWEELFGPRAPKRGGPLNVLVNLIVTIVVLCLLGVGWSYLMRFRDERQQQAAEQAKVAWATANAQATASAIALTAEAQAAALTAEAQPTPEPNIGTGTVTSGGNLRRDPTVSEANVIGLIWPGDQVLFLEKNEDATWYHIRIVAPAAERGGTGVAVGVDGWASASLLSPPTTP